MNVDATQPRLGSGVLHPTMKRPRRALPGLERPEARPRPGGILRDPPLRLGVYGLRLDRIHRPIGPLRVAARLPQEPDAVLHDPDYTATDRRTPRVERDAEVMRVPKPTSQRQARLFGAIAGGRATKARGMTATQAKNSLRGRKVKTLPKRSKRGRKGR
jgi:hypothetical protein